MRTRCPCCGTTVSLDALVAHEGAREALKAVFALGGPVGGAVVRYLGLFRPAKSELTMERVGKLVTELLPDLQAQRIARNGQVFDAPPEAWVWAIEQSLAARDDGRLKVPLKGHGWLYEVIASYRPASAVVVPETAGVLRGGSKTLAGIAALEALKNGS